MTDAYKDREIVVDVPEDDDPPWYIKPGEYPFKVSDAVLKPGQSGYDYVELTLQTLATGSLKEVAHRCSLGPKAIWNLKRTLEALGLPSRGKINLNLDSMVGRWLKAIIVDDEYKGRLKSTVEEVAPVDDGNLPDWAEDLPTPDKDDDWFSSDDTDNDLPF